MSFLSSLHPEGELFGVLSEMIQNKVPGFRIRYKDESLFHRVLGKLMFWTDYGSMTSTWFKDVWYPSKKFVDENPFRAFKILAHEYLHLMDGKEYPVAFPLLYLFPQCLSVLGLGAILAAFFSNWFLLFLVAVIFLSPMPAPFRSLLEMRGYAMNLAINIWKYGSVKDETRKWLEDVFTGWAYYRMDPNVERVRVFIAGAEVGILNIDKVGVDPRDTIFATSECYQDVYELLTGIEFPADEEEEV